MIEEQVDNVQMQTEAGQDIAPAESVDQTGQESAQAPQAMPKQDDKDRNLYEMRKRLEQEQREKEELRRQHDEAMRLLNQREKQSNPQINQGNQEESEDWNFGDDEDLAEVKHLKKMAAELKKQRKEFEEYRQQSTAVTAEARLRSQFSDLEKVVSKENLEQLSKEDPDLYTSLQHNPDVYSRYSAAYRAIKRSGIYREDKYVADKEKALTNANKPRPLTSVSPQRGDSPLSKANAFANGLTPDLKKQLWREMNEASERS